MERGLNLVGKEPWLSAASQLLRESGCEISKYRNNLTGLALTSAVGGHWWIETPRPSTAKRYAVLAHEVGHWTLHYQKGGRRWLEEVQAWDYALSTFDRFNLPDKEQVLEYAQRCVGYSIRKAVRRGATDFTGLPEHYAIIE